MADPNAVNRDYPSNERRGPDATQASTPAEPGAGRLDEDATLVRPTAVGPDLPPTPGLAPVDETVDALKAALGPGVESWEAREWMGSPEPATGFSIAPDGDPKNWPPSRGGFGPATER